MTAPQGPLSVQTIGPFSVTGPSGEDLTPKGAKARGLLAILALSEERNRPRRFLEEKLWSGRGPEQASQSLRQSLTEIRRALGDYRDLFLVDRMTVGFAPDSLNVDADSTHIDAEGHEILEGLKIRDPAFVSWIEDVRDNFERRKMAQAAKAKGLVLRLVPSADEGGPAALLSEVLSHQIGQNVTEQMRAWRQMPVRMAETLEDEADIEIDTRVVEDGGESLAFIRMIHTASGRVLHAAKAKVNDKALTVAGDDLMADVTVEAAERALDAMATAFPSERPEIASASLARRAVREMETFEAPRLEVADRLLESAFDIDQNGLFLAWQSLLRTIQVTEMVIPQDATQIEEIMALNARALELDGDNPLVQALVSQVQVLRFADIDAAHVVAQRPLDSSVAGAFGMVSLASANMMAGDMEAAYKLTKRATEVAARSSFHHWWDTFHCISCIASDRFDEAIISGERASARAPHFRPPLRHLLALYAHTGNMEKMEDMMSRLQFLEPDFSLERFTQDERYPVRTLRKAGLLNFPKSGLKGD
ncbi:MAG: hypothetical protein AAF393_16355 [Pseudomonadota bacterium]